MINVVEVAQGWTPPAGEKFAMVAVSGSGTSYFMDAVKLLEDNVRLFRANNDGPDIATAIDEAREWAAKNDASVVYLTRVPIEPKL